MRSITTDGDLIDLGGLGDRQPPSCSSSPSKSQPVAGELASRPSSHPTRRWSKEDFELTVPTRVRRPRQPQGSLLTPRWRKTDFELLVPVVKGGLLGKWNQGCAAPALVFSAG